MTATCSRFCPRWPAAADSAMSDDIRWVLLRTDPGEEALARRNLLQRAEKMDVADWIGRALLGSDAAAGAFGVPREGSLVVELRYDEKTWCVVSNTPGVIGFQGDPEPEPLQRLVG